MTGRLRPRGGLMNSAPPPIALSFAAHPIKEIHHGYTDHVAIQYR